MSCLVQSNEVKAITVNKERKYKVVIQALASPYFSLSWIQFDMAT